LVFSEPPSPKWQPQSSTPSNEIAQSAPMRGCFRDDQTSIAACSKGPDRNLRKEKLKALAGTG
jgi:hypothetical protein